MKKEIIKWKEKLNSVPVEEKINSIRKAMDKNNDGKYVYKSLNNDLLVLRGK